MHGEDTSASAFSSSASRKSHWRSGGGGEEDGNGVKCR